LAAEISNSVSTLSTMTSKRRWAGRPSDPQHLQPDVASRDFTTLPPPLDLSAVVETHDVDPAPHLPESPFATPEIEEMARTGAIGGGF
jgi:hypothetical protein